MEEIRYRLIDHPATVYGPSRKLYEDFPFRMVSNTSYTWEHDSLFRAVRDWCREQFGPRDHRWYAMGEGFYILFREESDVIAFRLRWGGR